MIRRDVAVPTLGMIELGSIAKGLKVSDAMLKKAEVDIILSAPFGCGKYLILLTGDEANLLEAVEAGRIEAGIFLENDFYIPNIHVDVVRALEQRGSLIGDLNALAVIESSSIASTIRAADLAAKRSAAKVVEITFDLDMGGKGYFMLLGDLGDVEASTEAATALLRSEKSLVHAEVVPAPHREMERVVRRPR